MTWFGNHRVSHFGEFTAGCTGRGSGSARELAEVVSGAAPTLRPKFVGPAAENDETGVSGVLWWLRRRKMYRVLLCITVWWLAAVVATLSVKMTVSPGSSSSDALYPYPFALTWWSNVSTGLLQFCLAQVVERNSLPRPPMRLTDIKQLVCIGIVQGTSIGCANKALEWLPISQRVIINSSAVLFQMLLAFILGLESLDLLRSIAAVIFVLGGAIQGLWGADRATTSASGHPRFVWGVALQSLAMVLGALQWALAQHVTQHSSPHSGLAGLSKLRMSAFIMPITAVSCLVSAVLFESDAFAIDHFLKSEFVFRVLTISLSVAVLYYAELNLVYLTSAVALMVLTTIHQVPIALAGVVLRGETVHPPSVAGFALSIAGGVLYALARCRDKERQLLEGDAERMLDTKLASSVAMSREVEGLEALIPEGC